MTNAGLQIPDAFPHIEEATARSLVENLGIGIALMDADMRILSVNARIQEWYYDWDFSQQPHCYEVFNDPPQDRVCFPCPVAKSFQDGLTHEAVSEVSTQLGSKHIRLITTPIRDEAGSITSVLELVEDVTDKVRLEQELRVRNQAIESATFGVLITGLGGEILYMNPFLQKISGWGPMETIVGKRITSLMRDPFDIENIIQVVVKNGRYEGIFSRTCKDGSSLDMRYNASVVLDDQQNPYCILCTMIDISARKQAEESLSIYRNIMENSQEAILICDPAGVIVTANRAFDELLGVVHAEIKNKNIWDYLPEQTRVLVEHTILPEVTKGGSWEGEFILSRANSGLFPAWGRAGSIHDETGKVIHIFVFMHDITEQAKINAQLQRSQAELEQHVAERTKALQKSELTLRALLDAIPESACMIDRDGNTLSVNVTLAQRLGLSVEEMIGKNMYDFLAPDLASVRKTRLVEVFRSGKPDRFIDKRLGRWIDNTVYPVRDEKGEVTSVAVLGIDVTERLKAEQALQEKATELMRSNAELEQFAYVASHDLQEPLRMVTSYLQLIAKTYDELLDQDGREYIQFAVDGAKRMNTLIRDLLTFSRVGTRSKEYGAVNLTEVLERVILNMKIPIEDAQANVEWENMPVIWAESTQMEQLFQNLMSNAIKFHGTNPPRIHISAQKRKDDWLFSVKDNGIGMDPRHAERVFVIFQRLHRRDEYPGTGIGLAICKKIVERHGGRIWVDSMPDKGSTFFFTIPQREGE